MRWSSASQHWKKPRSPSPNRMNEQAFIESHLAVGRSALVPGISLYLATELTPLWLATEDFLHQHNMAPPYWAFAWPGSEALACFIQSNPHLVAGKRVLDFAAGCGLAGIAAAKAGATRVDAAEIDPLAVAAIKMNAALNHVEVMVTQGDIIGQRGAWDVILTGDVCYEQAMAARVMAWLKAQADCSIVLMADPGRRYKPTQPGLKKAEYKVPTSLELEDSAYRMASIYQILV